ncbi:hypothetical protein [Streptomyces sp. DH12]|uniref:hypothetical protein n=1 Tax=Streptomyces sp. DH12 TaxID=2857010 RepID=UPI001E549850|nr:hypothetical protein [Streptomyces sp. DH12]
MTCGHLGVEGVLVIAGGAVDDQDVALRGAGPAERLVTDVATGRADAVADIAGRLRALLV